MFAALALRSCCCLQQQIVQEVCVVNLEHAWQIVGGGMLRIHEQWCGETAADGTPADGTHADGTPAEATAATATAALATTQEVCVVGQVQPEACQTGGTCCLLE